MKKRARKSIVLGIAAVFIAGTAVLWLVSDKMRTQDEMAVNERNNSMATKIPMQTMPGEATVLSLKPKRERGPLEPANRKIGNLKQKVLAEDEFRVIINTADQNYGDLAERRTRGGSNLNERNKLMDMAIPIQMLPDKADLLSSRQQKQKILKRAVNSKMSSRMNSLIFKETLVKDTSSKLSISDIENKVPDEDQLRVIFTTTDEDYVDLDEIRTRGGRILDERDNFVAVEVLADKIEAIVTHVDGIDYARFPHKLIPFSVASEGVQLTGANNSHNAGFTGSGIKVAIMDVGFKNLLEAQSNGEVPFGAITVDFTGSGLETQYKHGTACAEIVHDMAPDSELHLLKVSDEVDVYNAVDYCIDNHIDIISLSAGFIGTGPGDGTGPINTAFDQARSKGIFVVSSAGNFANSIRASLTGRHWKGVFHDSDLDNTHEFIPGDLDSYYNAITAIPDQDDDGNPVTNDVTVILRWNDWPNADIDYDIFLFDYDSGTLVASSTAIQNGSQQPLEVIVLDLPDSENYWHNYSLEVARKSGEPAGIELEIFLGGSSYFIPFYKYSSPISTSSSSIPEPADAQSVFTVGAINYNDWETGPQEDFSSQGPTNAWAGSKARIKPDICGPDGVSGYTYGFSSFLGTSAAAPHVAGVGALLLSGNPNLSVDELQTVIESRAIDRGSKGKDNIYGWGRLSINPVNQGGGGGSGGGGCFIASTAYGSETDSSSSILQQGINPEAK